MFRSFLLLTLVCTSISLYSDPPEIIYSDDSKLLAGMVTDGGLLYDHSYNQALWEGLLNCSDQYPVEIAYANPAGMSENDFFDGIQSLYDKGRRFIAASGFLLETAVYRAQNTMGDAHFVLLDGAPRGADYTVDVAVNTVSVYFDETEAAFLAGIATALQLKEGEVGFIGGLEIPVVQDYEWGFREGLQYANNFLNTAIIMRESDWVYMGSFTDSPAGYEFAKRKYDEGVQAFFCAAGAVGFGAIDAAKEAVRNSRNAWIVGVDIDQYHDGEIGNGRSVVLTSAIKKLDIAIEKILEKELYGKFPGGETIELGVCDNAVGIPVKNPNLEESVLLQVEEVQSKIKAGQIDVLKRTE